jgi:tetratricopeptide (TPR) repeat protein
MEIQDSAADSAGKCLQVRNSTLQCGRLRIRTFAWGDEEVSKEANMSGTLKLADRLLALGDNYARLGRDREAIEVLGKFAKFGDLPADAANEACSHLAEIHLRHRNFPKARRHLAAGLARTPDHARFHFLMASSLMEDEDGDVERALQHFHLAVRLGPDNAEYHCEYGLCLLSVSHSAEALKHLERAAQLAPAEAKYVRHLALAQLESGKGAAARRTLLAALFRSPRDPALRKLWNDLRFEEARVAQRDWNSRWRVTAADGPVLLPFTGGSAPKAESPRPLPAKLRLHRARRRPTSPRTRRQNS